MMNSASLAVFIVILLLTREAAWHRQPHNMKTKLNAECTGADVHSAPSLGSI